MYIDKLDDVVNEHNKIYHSTIKMKSGNVNAMTYIDFGVENYDKNPKFKFDDHIRILKYRNIFAKG